MFLHRTRKHYWQTLKQLNKKMRKHYRQQLKQLILISYEATQSLQATAKTKNKMTSNKSMTGNS